MNSTDYKTFNDYVKSLKPISPIRLFFINLRKKTLQIFNNSKCFAGIHNFDKYPTVCEVETVWIQGGKECSHCGKKKISFEQASKLIAFAYKKGSGRF